MFGHSTLDSNTTSTMTGCFGFQLFAGSLDSIPPLFARKDAPQCRNERCHVSEDFDVRNFRLFIFASASFARLNLVVAGAVERSTGEA